MPHDFIFPGSCLSALLSALGSDILCQLESTANNWHDRIDMTPLTSNLYVTMKQFVTLLEFSPPIWDPRTAKLFGRPAIATDCRGTQDSHIYVIARW
ncbi:hypothetical protein CPB84DRAFT_826623 [Gymnopilus junonius]|uniref:Uncharacterized protein n=1 Tax=Gymnopilus junonius TaxID=109634 RepID=A0A9P5N8Q9_GYMJU|nr:hypothetical protein CPB84DRAFT_826623 [Gymnopilus junonius]